MKYRYLGSTGLSVSELCFGAMTFGEKGAFLGAPGRNWSEFGVVSEQTAYDLVYKALDAGINFFDTADCYKNGQGEELLGNALKGRRQQVIIGTKGRWQTDPNPNALGASRYHIINAVEASLQRLKTDYIDIYHLHGFDPRTALEDTLRTLDTLIRDGKIRYIGVSNYAAWQLAKALGISLGWRNSASIRAITISPRVNWSMRLSRSASIRTSASPSGARWPGAFSPANTHAIRRFPRAAAWRTPRRSNPRRSPTASRPGRPWR